MRRALWVPSFLLLSLCCVLAVAPPASAGGDAEDFEPVYTGRVTKKSSLRSIDSTSGKLVATLYRNDTVELGEVGEEWTPARKGGKAGYILTESLKDLNILSPYRALPDGEEVFPYAATALAPTAIVGTVYGQTDALQTIPKDAVVAVGGPDQDGGLLLPYKRTVGRISADSLQLERVVPAAEAQPGDLIGVFSTFFTADLSRDLLAGRLHNIQKGVELLDGRTVAPGEQFSFNEVCAPYTSGNGYKKGPIINYVSDKKSGYGGGICQVSTTLYNVLLQLPQEMAIVRWQTHSSRGIEYAPVDFDAAVGAGNLDLSFINDAPFAVRMRLNLWDGVVTVRMYRDAGE